MHSTRIFNSDLNLPIKYSDRVKICFDVINSFLPTSEIYLFGSYAKRAIKEESDIDILVLVEGDYTAKALQQIRWDIEDALYEANKMDFEVDLKLYTKIFYKEQLAYSHFFMEIDQYKKDLRGIVWK